MTTTTTTTEPTKLNVMLMNGAHVEITPTDQMQPVRTYVDDMMGWEITVWEDFDPSKEGVDDCSDLDDCRDLHCPEYTPSYADCFPDPWAGDYAAIERGEL